MTVSCASPSGLDVSCLCIYTTTLQPENGRTEGARGVYEGLGLYIAGAWTRGAGGLFGPVVPISSCSGVEEVVEQANKIDYGLASYVFTGGAATANKISAAPKAGVGGVE